MVSLSGSVPTKVETKNTLTADSYTVKKGETLYSIAWRAGKDVRTLANINNISAPYNIYPGQIISLTAKTSSTKGPTSDKGKNKTKNVNKELKSDYKNVANDKSGEYGGDSGGKFTKVKVPSLTQKVKNWVWPVNGRIISSFSNSAQGNKGVDIAGELNQPVKAAAEGLVVYAGNALRGYGNLIIIKHNDDYLSAYAHNETLLVKEQESVKTGQVIAKMGNTGTDKTMLHFEIRFRGKSVDPTRYLPKK
ncbi:peptidoglycan DD-metalloendopeptidase family protein [Thalassotalea crassostreae]|uniref:peptidoglycan DD-metalloendopeptidase family protein n=1 Tax=Thalassotalea crassostreae TaxID=1763536 RepID=UPI001D0440A3|nr:peptidoglycan DD-metalloendopeptidase family protein [Thalassotalea crassostreae]